MTSERNKVTLATLIILAMVFKPAAAHGILSVAVAADSPSGEEASPQPVFPAANKNSAFHETFNGIFYNGQTATIEEDLRVAATSDTAVSVSRIVAGKSTVYQLRAVNSAFSPSLRELEALGVAYALDGVSSAGKGMLSLPLFVSQTDHEPVDIATNTTIQAGTRLVQGSGSKSGTLSFGAYSVPYTYVVSLASEYAGTSLMQSQGEVQEKVGAGDAVQTLSWHWTLKPE